MHPIAMRMVHRSLIKHIIQKTPPPPSAWETDPEPINAT